MSSVGSGTAVGYETLIWGMPSEAGHQRSDLRVAQRQSGEYRTAIPAEIASLDVSLPSDVLADAEEASQEIARFDTELGDEIAPFTSCCYAQISSQLQNRELDSICTRDRRSRNAGKQQAPQRFTDPREHQGDAGGHRTSRPDQPRGHSGDALRADARERTKYRRQMAHRASMGRWRQLRPPRRRFRCTATGPGPRRY